ncbi:type II secretion system protein GspL [Pseudomonas parafulva]|uniref:Type II secretion system protein GspL n=1 Tax=Pseudomonas parafulva TaxID=157782 RepID=A0AAI8PCM5_9PSED|nr:type II secretion system protein GspL [Pseudomonas parafulva]AXO89627.1 type II secretion system protein GspL [Pseudomonas parafulva]
MKVKRRWRAAPRPWLLLCPGEHGWRWRLQEPGEGRVEGQGRAPQIPGARVALVVPGEACSHFQLAAPPGLKREEWPLLLEDRLVQDLDAVDCACIGRTAGQLRLVVTARHRLDEWLAQCAAWGLQVERCWAEFQLPAAPRPGQGWHWQQGTQDLCARISQEGREQWLAWPQALGDVPWDDDGVLRFTGDWPPHWADLERLPSLRPLRRARRSLQSTPLQRRALIACAALAVVWGGLWLGQQWRQAEVFRQQVLAVTGAQASPRQAAQRLRTLQQDDDDAALRLRRLQVLQEQVNVWLLAHPHWRLRAVRFDGQCWSVQLEGEGAAPPWQDMAAAVGATVQVQSPAVVFDLGSRA